MAEENTDPGGEKNQEPGLWQRCKTAYHSTTRSVAVGIGAFAAVAVLLFVRYVIIIDVSGLRNEFAASTPPPDPESSSLARVPSIRKRASSRQLRSAFSVDGKQVENAVVALDCQIGETGDVAQCRVVWEQPEGLGISQSVIEVVEANTKMSPMMVDDKPVRTFSRITLTNTTDGPTRMALADPNEQRFVFADPGVAATGSPPGEHPRPKPGRTTATKKESAGLIIQVPRPRPTSLPALRADGAVCRSYSTAKGEEGVTVFACRSPDGTYRILPSSDMERID